MLEPQERKDIIRRRTTLDCETGAMLNQASQELLDHRYSHYGTMRPIEDGLQLYYIKRDIEYRANQELKFIQRDCKHDWGKWGYPDDGVHFNNGLIRKCRCCSLVQQQ